MTHPPDSKSIRSLKQRQNSGDSFAVQKEKRKPSSSRWWLVALAVLLLPAAHFGFMWMMRHERESLADDPSELGQVVGYNNEAAVGQWGASGRQQSSAAGLEDGSMLNFKYPSKKFRKSQEGMAQFSLNLEASQTGADPMAGFNGFKPSNARVPSFNSLSSSSAIEDDIEERSIPLKMDSGMAQRSKSSVLVFGVTKPSNGVRTSASGANPKTTFGNSIGSLAHLGGQSQGSIPKTKTLSFGQNTVPESGIGLQSGAFQERNMGDMTGKNSLPSTNNNKLSLGGLQGLGHDSTRSFGKQALRTMPAKTSAIMFEDGLSLQDEDAEDDDAATSSTSMLQLNRNLGFSEKGAAVHQAESAGDDGEGQGWDSEEASAQIQLTINKKKKTGKKRKSSKSKSSKSAARSIEDEADEEGEGDADSYALPVKRKSKKQGGRKSSKNSKAKKSRKHLQPKGRFRKDLYDLEYYYEDDAAYSDDEVYAEEYYEEEEYYEPRQQRKWSRSSKVYRPGKLGRRRRQGAKREGANRRGRWDNA